MNNLFNPICIDGLAKAYLEVNTIYAFLAIQIIFLTFALFVWLKNYKKWKPRERIVYQLLTLGVVLSCYAILFFFIRMRFVVCYL